MYLFCSYFKWWGIETLRSTRVRYTEKVRFVWLYGRLSIFQFSGPCFEHWFSTQFFRSVIWWSILEGALSLPEINAIHSLVRSSAFWFLPHLSLGQFFFVQSCELWFEQVTTTYTSLFVLPCSQSYLSLGGCSLLQTSRSARTTWVTVDCMAFSH